MPWPIPEPPPIYVTVQQPSDGIPEWIKILLSALAGLVVGLSIEFVKPLLERRRVKKIIAKHLAIELFRALHYLEIAIDVMNRASLDPERPESLTVLASVSIRSIHHPRLDSFVAQNIDIVNEIDVNEQLPLFYQRVELLPHFLDEGELQVCLDWAIEGAAIGQSYVIQHQLLRGFENDRAFIAYKEYADKRGVIGKLTL